MNIVILDYSTTNPGDLNDSRLRSLGNVTIYEHTKQSEIIKRASSAEILLINKTPLDREIIFSLPKLKYIGLLSTGYNIVDIAAAKERGITVTNVPIYSTDAVVQHTFALLFSLTNRVSEHSQAVFSGEWTACRDFSFVRYPICELSGKNFGIIGFGKIGKAVAKAAEAFGMNVLVYSRSDFPANNVLKVPLFQLLEQSDIVSLHCPLTPQTAGLINEKALARMKPSAFLINTSRGPVIDDAALANALNSGQLAGAAVDVLTEEPPKYGNPLLSAKNIIITPHIAWAAPQTRQRLLSIVTTNIEAFLKGTPQNTVNLID